MGYVNDAYGWETLTNKFISVEMLFLPGWEEIKVSAKEARSLGIKLGDGIAEDQQVVFYKHKDGRTQLLEKLDTIMSGPAIYSHKVERPPDQTNQYEPVINKIMVTFGRAGSTGPQIWSTVRFKGAFEGHFEEVKKDDPVLKKYILESDRRRLAKLKPIKIRRRACDSPVMIRLLEDIYRANGYEVCQ